MKGHMTVWLLSPGSGRWVNRSGSILRANEQAVSSQVLNASSTCTEGKTTWTLLTAKSTAAVAPLRCSRGSVNVIGPFAYVFGLVFVLVMDIRIVLVRVTHAFVMVRVRMRLVTIPFEIMVVLVVSVVTVRVAVIHRLVLMLVFVRLRQVQPDARAHQRCGHPESRIRSLSEYGQRNGRPDERRS